MAKSIIDPATSPAHDRSVLVSGAGFAGLTTAWWLNRLGYRVVIVEAAKTLRRGGTPVDIEGETIDVLTRMGLIEAVRAKALPPRGLEFKDEDDVTLASIGAEADPAALTRYEIHRDDLLDILAGGLPEEIELLFGRSIEQLTDGPDAVSVTFTDRSQRDFALVFGCDGNRSNTRRLVFGGDDEVTYFMGGYFFLKVVPQTGLLPANRSQVFSVPGRTALLNGYDDRTDICFGFRTEREIEYDYRDRAQQRRLIHVHFDSLGWKVPAMLASVKDDDFYFDRINQIRMPNWSLGRVALVGDAGYCVSPLAGFGGSMAIIGAGRLATSLERYPEDHVTAFRQYESGLRPFVEEVQERAATSGLEMMFPADDAEVAERDRKLAEGEIHL
jgi:2-polyprenyl-6-methoxyphenol hydroxylase-like FAD-dependent oxidoreductase